MDAGVKGGEAVAGFAIDAGDFWYFESVDGGCVGVGDMAEI